MADSEIRVVYNHLPAVIETIRKRENNLALDLANNVKEMAQMKAPKDTGNLARSIHVERVPATGQSTYIAQANTKYLNPALRDYAHYVEFGTRYMAAQPYLIPAYALMLTLLYPISEFSFGLPVETSAKTGSVV